MKKDCFGKYKMYIGHKGCKCDECLAGEDCLKERERRKRDILKETHLL